jgi:hypothetical protein
VTITTAGNCLLLIGTHRCAEMKVVSDIKRSEKDLPYLERTGRERGGRGEEMLVLPHFKGVEIKDFIDINVDILRGNTL